MGYKDFANKYEIKDDNGDTLFVEGVNNTLDELDATVPTTRKERSEIIEPGAFYAQQNLWKYAPYRVHQYKSQNYLGSKLRKPLHIKDPQAVTHKPNQNMDGSTEVGYTRRTSPIARWVELGTYRQDANPFMDRAYQNLDYDMLANLQAKAYENQMKRKKEKANQ